MDNGPHNLEAEKALLGSVFWSYSALQKVCEEVHEEVFSYKPHSKIFEVIYSLYQNKKPVDISTLTAEIISKGYLVEVGGVAYLNSIVDKKSYII